MSHISLCTWWCAACGIPPGGNVVSCTSNDSAVASLPFRTGRIAAPFTIFTGSSLNGYVVEEMELSWFGNPSNATALETNPEIRKSTSRRVADIRVLLRKKVYG